MKFKVRRASLGYFTVIDEVEIKTVDDLMEFIDKLEEDIIFDKMDGETSILIYDCYIE